MTVSPARSLRFALLVTITMLVALFPLVGARAAAAPPPVQSGPVVSPAVHMDVSPPLREIIEQDPAQQANHENHPAKPFRHPAANRSAVSGTPSSTTTASAPATGLNFDGVGNGFTGPSGTFTVNSAPPDTNLAVGPNHVVEIVNSDFAIFNKSGTAVFGPVAINTLWSGFGGNCQTDNDGDPIAKYDSIADRWVLSQFAVTSPNPDYLQCVAVSQTPDPTGAYYRYSFSYGNQFPDYPKMSVWPDAYYITFNMFNSAGTSFLGAQACAYDRARMLTGSAATQQCFSLGTTYGGVLPSDLDGSRPPPAGAPNYIVADGASANQLAYWTFHTDWTTPASTTLTGPSTLATAAFTTPCNGTGGTCVPQSGTSQQLDTLGDRLMYRFAYRNFGDHEALVVNRSVTAGSSTGIRWYELRTGANNNLNIFQQGTYAPDANSRWMGSIAQDQAGDMGLGFSTSGSSLHPEIRYTGRLAGDPAGTMTQGEGTVIAGAGSQTTNLSRWGDYSAMAVDPSDGCTFWYGNEYIPSNGTFNWRTRIGTFKFPNCGTPPPANDFSISAAPASQTVNQGAGTSYTVSTATTAGTAQTVNLSSSGLPAGAAATFNPTSVTSGGTSTMAVTTSTSTAAGSYTITITGTGATTHSTTVSLVINGPGGIVNGGFETDNYSGWTTAGTTSISTTSHTGSYSAMVGGSSPTNGDSTISQTFSAPNPTGTLSFWYRIVCPDTLTYDWASATLTDNTAATTTTLLGKTCSNSGAWVQSGPASLVAGHSYTLTLLSHDDNYASDPTYTLFDDVALTAPPSPDFALSASPASQSVAQGGSTSYTITVTAQNGFTGTVNLSASGFGSGASGTFSPASVAGSGTSTLTVTTTSSAATGSFPITINGVSGTLSHNTSVTLVVNPPPDFTIAVNPSSQTVTQGNGTSYTATVTAQNGFAGSVSLSVSGLGAGASGGFNPNPISGGGSSTLSVTTTSGAQMGTFPLTITGTSGSLSHSASATLVVNPAPPPDFAISVSPASQTVTQGNGTTYTATVTAQNGFTGTVSLAASGFGAGAGGSFNPSTVSGGGNSTLTVTTTSAATTGTFPLSITGSSGSLSHSASATLVVNPTPTSVIVNGGFETGAFTGWSPSGSTAISTTSHTGTYSAQVGSASPFNGDSKIAQTFNAPSGTGHALSFWYRVVCTDSVTYDWATATLKDNTANTTTTVLAKTCTNNGSWVQKSVGLTGAHSYTLTLIDHDDNWVNPPDPTYTLYDDVAVS
ncbi:MAG TPA: hypothetical protein VIO62_14210 [Candidatus Dormibacteraeota bacterium]